MTAQTFENSRREFIESVEKTILSISDVFKSLQGLFIVKVTDKLKEKGIEVDFDFKHNSDTQFVNTGIAIEQFASMYEVIELDYLITRFADTFIEHLEVRYNLDKEPRRILFEYLSLNTKRRNRSDLLIPEILVEYGPYMI